MRGGELVREARRRAGLTQSRLARRMETSQPMVARWERGAVSPTYESLQRAVRACGFELDVRLARCDEGLEHDWSLALQNLRLTPEQRLEQVERTAQFISAGREAMARAARPGG